MGAVKVQVIFVGVVDALGVEFYKCASTHISRWHGADSDIDLRQGLGGETEKDGFGTEGSVNGHTDIAAAFLIVGVVGAVFVDVGGDGVGNLGADAVASVELNAETNQHNGEKSNKDEGDGSAMAAGELSLRGSRFSHAFIVPGVLVHSPLYVPSQALL